MTVPRAFRQTVCERISALRHSCPQSSALHSGHEVLSYEQLDIRAEKFAAYLLQSGVTPGSTVAICLGRSPDWIIAALGTMRAGAAYVPLDPAWPDSRLLFALADSEAKAFVAPSQMLRRLGAGAVGIDPVRDRDLIAKASGTVPEVEDRLDGVAYVIYTSGSTGAPKGVELTHTNLLHLIEWHTTTFQLTQSDRTSHLAGLGFDAAVWEIWPALWAGATLCLPEESVRSSPALIQQWMVEERITIGFVPTVHANPMLAMTWPASTALRYLLTGGDVLHQAPARSLPFAVVNNYGPTECTVVSTSAVIAPGGHGTPAIGRPISGMTVYLLDDEGKQVRDGEIGEMYIGGRGVGRGYRNLPEATAKCFLPDPFAAEANARMYRSGDLGARRADGQIDFHGRKDRQVQIRGQRVELDEIDGVLGRHPDVAFAVTTARPATGGGLELTAYILPNEASIVTSTDLQKYLLRTLPSYMVPAVYVQLSTLPVSPSGKIDLTRLPSPNAALLLPKTLEAASERSPIELKLLSTVRELLHDGEIGVEDNFFLAGGHSLLGMQLVMHLSEDFDVEVSLQELFEAPTVKQLALFVEAKLDRVSLPPAIASQAESHRKSNHFFLVHYRSDYLARALSHDQTVSLVNLTPEDLQEIGKDPSLEEIAADLVRRIVKVQPEGPYVLGGYCVGGVLAYEIACQMRSAGREVSMLTLLDTPSPTYYGVPHLLAPSLREPRYLIQRVSQLGVKVTFERVCDRLLEKMPERVVKRYTKPNSHSMLSIDPVHKALTLAAADYQPKKYAGKVLLLLAADHAPHFNFLEGWQTLAGETLEVEHIAAHHNDLTRLPMANHVAALINAHLCNSTRPSCSVSLHASTEAWSDGEGSYTGAVSG